VQAGDDIHRPHQFLLFCGGQVRQAGAQGFPERPHPPLSFQFDAVV